MGSVVLAALRVVQRPQSYPARGALHSSFSGAAAQEIPLQTSLLGLAGFDQDVQVKTGSEDESEIEELKSSGCLFLSTDTHNSRLFGVPYLFGDFLRQPVLSSQDFERSFYLFIFHNFVIFSNLP